MAALSNGERARMLSRALTPRLNDRRKLWPPGWIKPEIREGYRVLDNRVDALLTAVVAQTGATDDESAARGVLNAIRALQHDVAGELLTPIAAFTTWIGNARAAINTAVGKPVPVRWFAVMFEVVLLQRLGEYQERDGA